MKIELSVADLATHYLTNVSKNAIWIREGLNLLFLVPEKVIAEHATWFHGYSLDFVLRRGTNIRIDGKDYHIGSHEPAQVSFSEIYVGWRYVLKAGKCKSKWLEVYNK